MSKKKEKRIIILGGGPAGIGAAYRLKELGHENWKLYEKENFLGGLSASFNDDKGFIWDTGGHIYFSKNDIFNKVFKKIQGKNYFEKERHQFIFWGKNTLIPYPFQNNIRHLPANELIKCLKDLADVKFLNPKNFLEFNLASFGAGITEYFMGPYNEKVWAHPLKKISFSWIGNRVSRIDLGKILENVILKKDEKNWGPNFNFKYPKKGGSGDFWQRFKPILKDNIIFGSEFKKIDLKKKKIYFVDGKISDYDFLISSLPLDFFIKNSNASQDSKMAAKNLIHNSGFVLGLGIKGNQPLELKNKIAFYLPQRNILFQRMIIFKNFTPHIAPKGHWSLIFEASFSKYKKLNKDRLVENALYFVKKMGWVKSKKGIVSKNLRRFEYFYPVPTLDRDKNLNKIQKELGKKNIHSIGRFGAWKYEKGNMDHGFVMGVEAVNSILNLK